MHTLLLSMMFAQPVERPAVPSRPLVPGFRPTAPVAPVAAEPVDNFTEIYNRAVARGEFIVWLDEMPYEDFDKVYWNGRLKSGVVTISGPHPNGRHVTYKTLERPTVAEVQDSLSASKNLLDAQRKGVTTRVASPKSVWPLPSAGETVDRDLSEAGPLPDGFVLPTGMQRYKRAAMTQAISVLNDGGRYDIIRPVPRLNLPDQRWHQSGGMLGIAGWRSDLYRYLPEKPRVTIDDIAVFNGSSNQNNRGYKIEFPVGSKFLDVLSSGQGKVFEVRQREKLPERWSSSVVFTDEQARPSGYNGLRVSCSSCHNKSDGPGTGGYAVGMVPGSDTVFSVGIDALESGQGYSQLIEQAPQSFVTQPLFFRRFR